MYVDDLDDWGVTWRAGDLPNDPRSEVEGVRNA